QVLVVATPWRFDSSLGHHQNSTPSCKSPFQYCFKGFFYARGFSSSIFLTDRQLASIARRAVRPGLVNGHQPDIVPAMVAQSISGRR
ncbi:MAG: hypothetical protein RKO68_07490, partial [Candidatus Accumulibacter sp.]|nr:hypothetical protein [Accumulibacter sp.]HMY07598.1 hypothetical protein [Accumulibacter sp.]HNC18193.1 hypothetical protein [Accumulibacter sp.]